MKALGYIRVSTDKQANSGLGMAAQQAAIETACARRGIDLIEVFTDAGISGTKNHRPGLNTAKQLLKDGKADALIVAKLDRLSRSLIGGLQVLEQAEREGWKLITLDNQVDTSTPSGAFMANILLSAAQYERALVSQRTKDGLAAARARGTRLGAPGRQSPETLARVAELQTQGHTYQAIADALTAEGFKTPKGGKWHRNTVRALLRSQQFTEYRRALSQSNDR